MRHLAAYLFLMLAASTQPALAGVPVVLISDAWVRAVPGSDVAAVYFTASNTGQTPVALIGVTSPVAASAMIHETTLTGTQSAMRPRAQVPIAAQASIHLAPDGMHVMLVGLKHPLKAGDQVLMVLSLEGADPVSFTARVRALSEQ